MINIDFEETKDGKQIIIYDGSKKGRKENQINIDFENPEGWNKESINKFLINLVKDSDENLDPVIVSENAKKEIQKNENTGKTISFIIELFNTFVSKYNQTK
ncbi:hypothetical protein [Metamycoplasma canadense]|uniref:Uncharacterized protein n=1 Tax=Metamycoplasma canadense TaxID=29554 RepID=A0A077L678_9BACT|nr:hypothetical protein [Metamycoplasma canadense]BAP39800.1 hypothetical protein MCAN360_0786 [Metamycoplasma canadense]